ncbi:MAG: S8 family serine peptidase [Lachnospiraceae bacterium]|nr:S8 family serine peptidase [Lachnospiraceae bacterium]
MRSRENERAYCGNFEETLFAPGCNVPVLSNDGGYTAGSGTSYAAAYVSGIAALYYSLHSSGCSGAQMKTILMNAADRSIEYSGSCVSGGRLNAYKVVYPHTYVYCSEGLFGHEATCTHCGYSGSEGHTWVHYGLQYRCTKCGLIASVVPVEF